MTTKTKETSGQSSAPCFDGEDFFHACSPAELKLNNFITPVKARLPA